MSLGDILTIVLPLLLPVLIGWGLVRSEVLTVADSRPLSTIFLWVCAPATLVILLAGEDLDDLLEGRLVFAIVAAFALVWGATFLVFRGVLRRDQPTSAFAALSASGFNVVSLGVPLMLAVFGSRGMIPIVVATIVFFAILVPLTVALASAGADGADGTAGGVITVLRSSLRTTLTNPIVIATGIGLLLAGLDVTLPVLVDNSLRTLANATIVTALVALGMTIRVDDLRSSGLEVVSMSIVKAMVAPAVALGAALLLGISDLGSAAFVVMFSLPTANTVFALSRQAKAYEREAAGIVAATTVSMVVLLPLWISIADHLWPSAFQG